MSGLLIQCQDVWKRYGRKEALCGLNLRLESGKIVGLLGPNGSGKTTLIKVLNGLLQPDGGTVLIEGEAPGVRTKSMVSYLPDKPYFAGWMRVSDLFDLFADFYMDFDRARAEQMCQALQIDTGLRMKTLSKGTKEKVQLILVMSRRARLYNPDGTVLISTHLISDVERVLDEVVFIQNGRVVRQDLVDDIREKEGKSVDELFREVFRTVPYGGGEWKC